MTTQNSDALLKKLYLELMEARQKLASVETKVSQDMAIVGAACRFPGNVDSLDRFWELLCSGTDPITPIPESRWNHTDYYDAKPDQQGKTYAKEGGFVADVHHFDPLFFELSPREAAEMDPQQRLLLELSWEAINHAGHDLTAMKGSNTGVFVGMSTDDYAGFTLHSGNHHSIDAYNSLGTARSVAAGRIAYTWGFHGPVIQLDTACSSSLVALHQACSSITNGDCDQALVAGINLILSSEMHIACSRLQALSPTNRCRVFDDGADGYVRSEGAGCVLVKPLAKALADGDRILGVIKSSSINHDGKSNGLTAPNGRAQQELINAALKRANIRADQIGYIETHGTGTRLGDPIELNAINSVLSQSDSSLSGHSPLLVGSVKSNIGHLEAAAGMASLLKALLIQQHGTIPSNLHFSTPNQQIPWHKLNLKVVSQSLAWPQKTERNLIGVNAFGLSGTNVHVIVGPAPEKTSALSPSRDAQLLTLAGKDRDSLIAQLQYAIDACDRMEPSEFTNWCSAHALHSSHFSVRKGFVASSSSELKQSIALALTNLTTKQKANKLCFVFTGQGAQYAGMGLELAQQFPGFRYEMDKMNPVFESVFGYTLEDLWWGDLSEKLNQTQYTQPALFAFEYCLAKTLMGWGIKPDLCLGHSVGEYVGLCLSGMLCLETTLQCLAFRANSMAQCSTPGAMVAILGGPDLIEQAITDCGLDPADKSLSFAAFNSPNSTVISGSESATLKIMGHLLAQDIRCVRLDVSHAFHSPLMATAADEMQSQLPKFSVKQPSIPLVSNITANVLSAQELTPSYLANHIVAPVQFTKSIEFAHQQGIDTFVEIGPKSTLTQVLGQIIPKAEATAFAAIKQQEKPVHSLLQLLAELYESNLNPDWKAVLHCSGLQDIPRLPYPFRRQYLWTKSTKLLTTNAAPNLPATNAPVKNTPLAEFKPISSRRTEVSSVDVRAVVMNILSDQLALPADRIDPETPFLELGLDSIMAVEIEDDLSDALGLSLPSTLLFDAPCTEQLIQLLCKHLDTVDAAQPDSTVQTAPHNPSNLSATHQLLNNIRELDDRELDRLLSA